MWCQVHVARVHATEDDGSHGRVSSDEIGERVQRRVIRSRRLVCLREVGGRCEAFVGSAEADDRKRWAMQIEL
jgi:hypothetical protein